MGAKRVYGHVQRLSPIPPPSKLKAPSQNRPFSGRAQSHEVLWPSPTLPSLRSPETSSTAAIIRAAPNSLLLWLDPPLPGGRLARRRPRGRPGPQRPLPLPPADPRGQKSSSPLRHSANSALSICERIALQWEQESTRRARQTEMGYHRNRPRFFNYVCCLAPEDGQGSGSAGQCEISRPLYGIRRKASKGLNRRSRVLQNPHAWVQVPPSPLNNTRQQ